MKKILIALLTVCIAASFMFGGCGSGSLDNATTSYIRVWIHKSESDDEGKIYKALANDFNDAGHKTADGSKDLKIRVEYKGTAETLYSAISSEILTGGLPDVISVDSPNYSAYVNEGIIRSIDEYVSAEELAEYLPQSVEQYKIDGKLYGLSGIEGPAGLYYNKKTVTKSVLTACGLSDYGTIENPWSWRDLYKVLKELRKTDTSDNKFGSRVKTNFGFGGTEGLMWLYYNLVVSAGGSFNDGETVKGYLDGEKSLKGIRMLELITKNDDNGNNYAYTGNNDDAFLQGVVPFQIFGAWSISEITKRYPDMDGNYGIMPLPVYEDENGVKGSVVTPCGGWGMSVTKDCEKAADAATVVKYLTGKEAGLRMYEGLSVIPTSVEILNTHSAFTANGPMKDLVTLLEETAMPRPVLVKYPKLSQAYSDIIGYVTTMSNDPLYDLETWTKAKANI